MGQIEKKSMSPDDRMKVLRAVLLSSGAAALIGAFVRNKKAKDKEMKRKDVYANKNTIVVPVSQTGFLSEIPTPEDVISARGIGVSKNASEEAREKCRRFDFFSKSSSSSDADDVKPDAGDKVVDEDTDKIVSSEKINGRTVLRGDDGRFMSPTDPIAVEGVSKEASGDGDGSITDFVTSPMESLRKVWDATTDKPVWYTAGALGSVYLAAKISDAINKRRQDRAKRRAEKERGNYIRLLAESGNEKNASDPRETVGATLGASFLIPFALSAMIAHKIDEKRKKDEKKRKEAGSDFPEHPVILYRTIDDKELGISPKTAMAAIEIGRSMMVADDMQKSAVLGGALEFLKDKALDAAGGVANMMNGGEMTADQAAAQAVNALTDDKNKAHLLNVLKAKVRGTDEDFRKAFSDMIESGPGSDSDKLRFRSAMKNPETYRAVSDMVSANGKVRDAIVKNIESNPDFENFTNDVVENGAFGTNGLSHIFKPGSFLYNIINWFMQTFGIGKRMVVNGIKDRFSNAQTDLYRGRALKQQQGQGGNSQVQGGNSQAPVTNNSHSLAKNELAGNEFGNVTGSGPRYERSPFEVSKQNGYQRSDADTDGLKRKAPATEDPTYMTVNDSNYWKDPIDRGIAQVDSMSEGHDPTLLDSMNKSYLEGGSPQGKAQGNNKGSVILTR